MEKPAIGYGKPTGSVVLLTLDIGFHLDTFLEGEKKAYGSEQQMLGYDQAWMKANRLF